MNDLHKSRIFPKDRKWLYLLVSKIIGSDIKSLVLFPLKNSQQRVVKTLLSNGDAIMVKDFMREIHS